MAAQTTTKPTATQPWSGRFSEPVAELVKRFTASVGFDRRLAEFDIEGSLAHARMLRAADILSAADLAAIEQGLAQIRAEIRAGTFAWSVDLEDVHLNIESRLTELVGDAGKRLHTARSRNDQVATDVRLYLRARDRRHRRADPRRCSARCSISPTGIRTPSCRASPTCRSRSRSRSAIT